jgi:hypothetical protein
VRSACGITQVQVNRAQDHFVLPELLTQFRSRLEEPVLNELRARQAAAAMEQGVVSPAHLGVDTFPSAQGSQRVTEAAPLDKAKKKSSRSARRFRTSVPRRAQPGRCRPSTSPTILPSCGAAVAASAAGRGKAV